MAKIKVRAVIHRHYVAAVAVTEQRPQMGRKLKDSFPILASKKVTFRKRPNCGRCLKLYPWFESISHRLTSSTFVIVIFEKHYNSKIMDITLSSAIEKAKNTQKMLVHITSRSYDYRKLVELRVKLQTDLLTVSVAIRNDPLLKEDPARLSMFSKRHHEAQNALSQHQARWLFIDIENDWQSYQQATSDLRRAQDDYFSWATLECKS